MLEECARLNLGAVLPTFWRIASFAASLLRVNGRNVGICSGFTKLGDLVKPQVAIHVTGHGVDFPREGMHSSVIASRPRMGAADASSAEAR